MLIINHCTIETNIDTQYLCIDRDSHFWKLLLNLPKYQICHISTQYIFFIKMHLLICFKTFP